LYNTTKPLSFFFLPSEHDSGVVMAFSQSMRPDSPSKLLYPGGAGVCTNKAQHLFLSQIGSGWVPNMFALLWRRHVVLGLFFVGEVALCFE
jgi:hypothetical protein